MDLGAYARIDELSEIMEKNGIEVPRLRGLRLMGEERPITKQEYDDIIAGVAIDACDDACRSGFKMNPNWLTYSWETDQIVKKYMYVDGGGHPIGVRWDKLHGKKRKVVKYEIRKAKKRHAEQWKVFNKYCGRSDVLYIHARIGGGNWEYYDGKELEKQPWFIEKVDDAFDGTYCDIYARIADNVV